MKIAQQFYCWVAESQDKYARVKAMKPATEGNKKTVRMFLVCEPPAEGQGQWATDAVEAFDGPLKTYLWGPRSPDGSSPGQGDDE